MFRETLNYDSFKKTYVADVSQALRIFFLADWEPSSLIFQLYIKFSFIFLWTSGHKTYNLGVWWVGTVSYPFLCDQNLMLSVEVILSCQTVLYLWARIAISDGSIKLPITTDLFHFLKSSRYSRQLVYFPIPIQTEKRKCLKLWETGICLLREHVMGGLIEWVSTNGRMVSLLEDPAPWTLPCRAACCSWRYTWV